MNQRARFLVEDLKLEPHPEGGYYRSAFRSARHVKPGDARPQRLALSSIYFLLARGQRSRWHRVLSDEVWCFLEGDPVTLFCFDEGTGGLTTVVLGRHGPGAEPLRVVPAGAWQAAEPAGEYTLTYCCVGPGFEFSDFAFAVDHRAVADAIRARGPEFDRLL